MSAATTRLFTVRGLPQEASWTLLMTSSADRSSLRPGQVLVVTDELPLSTGVMPFIWERTAMRWSRPHAELDHPPPGGRPRA